MLSFAASLGLTATRAGLPYSGSSTVLLQDPVNRALKGDRLRVIVRPPDAAPYTSGAPRTLLDGCESAIAPVQRSLKASLAQSCVT
jgi:hypothetical protein